MGMGMRLGVVLVVPVLLSGCGDSGVSDGGATGRTVPDLDGTSWIATSIREAGRPHGLVPGSQLRVEFADGTLSINAGCNALGGSYTLSEESELGTTGLSGTEMGCDPPLMDQDAWLSGTVFAEPLVASVSGDTLTLTRQGLELVLVDRHVVARDALLEGTTWQLDGLRAGETTSSVPAGHTATLILAADGAIAVDTGCNRGRGTATVDGAMVTFGPLTMTRKACAAASGRQTEAAILAVLDGEVTWSITEQTLTLTRGDRGLVYRAAA